MKPVEILLSLANLLAFFVLAIPLPHAVRWVRYSALIALLIAGEACRLEPRLQACLVMDAPMTTGVVQTGLQQPGIS